MGQKQPFYFNFYVLHLIIYKICVNSFINIQLLLVSRRNLVMALFMVLCIDILFIYKDTVQIPWNETFCWNNNAQRNTRMKRVSKRNFVFEQLFSICGKRIFSWWVMFLQRTEDKWYETKQTNNKCRYKIIINSLKYFA